MTDGHTSSCCLHIRAGSATGLRVAGILLHHGARMLSHRSQRWGTPPPTPGNTDMFRAGEIDPSAPGQAFCLEAYKESEMFYLSLINRLDQK